MESIVDESPAQEEITYPCLRKYVDGDEYLIVLFNKYGTGIVVGKTAGFLIYELGHFGSDWSMSATVEFEGTVTLSNSRRRFNQPSRP